MADVDEPSQADLVEIIQSVHTSLREKAEKISPEDLWDEHCKDVSTLAKYRVAMKKLATQHWECSAANERIEWCLCTVREYFQKGGLQRALDKDERRRKYKEKSERVTPSYNSSSAGEQDYTELETHLYSRPLSECDGGAQKLCLLDVGSCYNPFSAYSGEVKVIPIDINPADDSVFCGDIVRLELTGPLAEGKELEPCSLPIPIRSLPGYYFDTVVFSLLLSYLPSPSQRWTCCVKAHMLLKVNGLLLVITPDSKHQNRNVPMMKRWKVAIESIGFVRWRYVKHNHAHCMAFRKLLTPARHEPLKEGPSMLTIPQEFNASKQPACQEQQAKRKRLS